MHSCRGRLTKRGRPGWDEYFLGIAVAVSTRADCSRRRVGALVVRWDVQPDGRKLPRIVSTGYNGSPPGGPSCLQGECPRATSGVAPGSSYDTGVGACVAVHAEGNAIIYAGRDNCLGSTLYVTEVPCDGCSRLIAAAGVARVVTPWGSTPDVG
nr:deaminase [Micromonospora salmantinae]